MGLESRWFPRTSLTTITGIAAATLGLLMTIGGLALGVAVLSTQQPGLQAVTAGVLLTTGVLNLQASIGIRREKPRAMLVSAIVTVALMSYLGGGLRDFGEPFLVHGLYLLLLLSLISRVRKRVAIAA
jgi:hypothetical protein